MSPISYTWIHERRQLTETYIWCRVAPEKIRFVRQSATFTGFDTPNFQEALNNLADVHAIMARSLPGTVQNTSIVTDHANYSTIEIGNRYVYCTHTHTLGNDSLTRIISYFTPSKDAEAESDIKLNTDLDPHGTLTKAADGDFIHTSDNVVVYNERLCRGDGYR